MKSPHKEIYKENKENGLNGITGSVKGTIIKIGENK